MSVKPLSSYAFIFSAALVSCHIALPAPAAAQTTEAEAVATRIVKSIEALGAKVEIGSRTANAASRSLDFANIVVTATPANAPRLVIEIPKLTVVGLGGTGGFVTAQSLTVPRIRLVGGEGQETAELTDLVASEFRLPESLGAPVSAQKPFSDQLRRFKVMLSATIRDVAIASATVTVRTPDGKATTLSTRTMKLAGIASGNIAEIALGGLTLKTPAASGETTTTLDAATVRAVNLNSYVRLFDPDSYLGGAGDRTGRTLIGAVTLSALEHKAETAVRVAGFELTNLTLRQAQQPFLDLMDRAAVDPKGLAEDKVASARLSASILGSIALEKAALRGLQVGGAGRPEFKLESVGASAASFENLGELTLTRGELTDPSGVASFGSMVIGGLRLPPLAKLQELAIDPAKARAAGPGDLAPTLGLIRLTDGVIAPKDRDPARLGSLSIEAERYLGVLPTAFKFEIKDLAIPAANFAAPGARNPVAEMGYAQVKLGALVRAEWNESSRDLRIEDFEITLLEAGSLVGNAILSGVPREGFESPRDLSKYLSEIGIRRIRLEYRDASLFEKGLGLWAKSVNQPPENLRRYILGVAQNAVSPIPDQNVRRRLGEAFTAFVQTPRSLTLTTNNTTPILFPVLATLAQVTPQQIPVVLKIDAEANRWTPNRP